MAHNLVDVNTWTAAITVPDDGDAANAMSVEVAFQDVGDRTLYLRNRLPGAAASIVVVVPVVVSGRLSRFTWGASAVPLYPESIAQTDTTDAGFAHCLLTGLPPSGTITSISAMVTGLATAGAHGGLLGTAPTIELFRRVQSTLAETSIVSAADPYATTNLALYEVPHAITPAAISEALSSDRLYRVVVTGEDGANKANNKFAVCGFKLTITP